MNPAIPQDNAVSPASVGVVGIMAFLIFPRAVVLSHHQISAVQNAVDDVCSIRAIDQCGTCTVLRHEFFFEVFALASQHGSDTF
jgi:hypothetical protein